MIVNKINVLLMLLMLFSCKKEPLVLNGSSQQEFDESIENITKDLPLLQQKRLKEAVQIIYQFDDSSLPEEVRWSKIRNMLNEKTSEEVFDFADRISKEKGLNWNSKLSTSTLNFDNLNKDKIKIDSSEVDYTSIKNVSNLSFEVNYFDKNKDDIKDGIMIFPTLYDNKNNPISFNKLPLKSIITLYSERNVIYTINVPFSQSSIGSVTSNRGIYIPFSKISVDKIMSNSVDIEMKLPTPNKYLVHKELNIPFNTSEWKIIEDLKNQSQQNNKIIREKEAIDLVKNFLTSIGKGKFKQAYELSDNPKWKNLETFSSPNLGFGSVKEIEIAETSIISSTQDNVVVLAKYKAYDSQKNSKSFSQNYTLKAKEGKWIIADAKIIP